MQQAAGRLAAVQGKWHQGHGCQRATDPDSQALGVPSMHEGRLRALYEDPACFHLLVASNGTALLHMSAFLQRS